MIRITEKSFNDSAEVLSYLEKVKMSLLENSYARREFRYLTILQSSDSIENKAELFKSLYLGEGELSRSENSQITFNLDTAMSLSPIYEEVDTRLIFPVAGKFLSIFDIVGYTDDDVLRLLSLATYVRVFVPAYCHFINKVDYERAQKAIELFNNRGSTVIISSSRQMDLVPYLLNEKNIASLSESEKLFVFRCYLDSLYYADKFPIYKLPIDTESHLKIMRLHSREIQRVNDTRLDIADVDSFDLVESSATERYKIFRLKNYDAINTFQRMLKQDTGRTLKLITTFFNQEHKSGKGKTTFVANYARMKKILTKNNIEFDVFQLNQKLRSYVLLEILS